MKYLSVCSGIEAATAAWHPLDWSPVGFSEIEAFPSAVLAHHYPNTPNLGDMERFHEWPESAIDVLVGGTPCQSFSVAGLRKGLDDPRGNLALVYLAIAERYRPRWLVWENVPGVLSSDEGRAMGSFLGGLAKLGYGYAWRVLDAQYFGLAQRRKRVFVVGYLGDWRPPAAVLLEPEGMRRDSAPSREAGERAAPSLAARTRGGGGLGTDAECDGGLIPEVAATVTAGVPNGGAGYGARSGHAKDSTLIASHEVAQPLLAKSNSSHRVDAESYVAHALTAEGFDASEDGTGRGTPLVPEICGAINSAGGHAVPGNSVQDAGVGQLIPHAFDARQSGVIQYVPKSGLVDTCGYSQAVAFAQNQREEVRTMRVAGALAGEPGMKQQTYVSQSMSVRRLTPRECERLQGFPDDYTLIPYRGKPAEQCPDGPRYKALGNSMAVPVMRWIGRRISLMDEIKSELENAP